MTTVPANSIRAARAVQQRDRLARVIARTGLTLGVAGAATLLALVGDRVWGWDLPWWTLPIPTVLAGAAGVAWGLATHGRLLAAATRLDAALGWHDRIASAIGFADRPAEPDAFVTLAVADAERMAPGARADRAVPIIWGRGWTVWAGALTLAIAGFLFLPGAAPGGPGAPNALDRERQAAAIAQIEEAERALAEIEPDPSEENAIAGASEEDLAAFEDLKRSLEADADPREALAEAAERIDRAADRLDQRAGDAAAAEEALRETLDETLDDASAMDERAREMVERLREGDLAGARRAAQEMLGNADQLAPEERERLARNLDDLARALEQRAEEPTPPDTGTAPESVDDLAQRLQQEQNLTEQAAREAAERELESQRRERAEREAAEDARRLSDAMRRTAEDLRQPPGESSGENQATEGQQGEPTEGQTEGQTQGQQPEGDPGGNQPGDPRQPGQQPGEQPGDQEGDGRDPSRSSGEQASPDDQGQPAGGSESEDPSGRSPQESSDPTAPSPSQGDRGEQGTPADPDGREAGTPEQAPEGGSASPDAQQGEVDQGQRSEGDPQQGGETREGPSEGQQPGQQPADQPADEPGDQQSDQPGQQQDPQPGQQETQPGGGAQGGEPAPDQQAQDQQPGDPGSGAQPDSSGEGLGQGQPQQGGSDQGPQGQQPGQPGSEGRDESGQSPEGGNSDRDSGGDGSGIGSGEELFRELDRLRERNEGLTRDREQAERLRQQAQRMLDQASPEERERLEDLARQYAERLQQQGSGDPFEEQVFDARARDDSPEVRGSEEQRANLLEDEPGQGGSVTGGQPMTGERVRNAAQSAERAIEQQGVPRRYRDLVRDVFRRYQKTVQEQEPGFAPLGTDATREGTGGGGGGGEGG